MIFNKQMVSFSFLLATLFLIGCGGGDNPPCGVINNGEKKQLSIAVIPKGTGGEFWETVGKGAKQAAKDLGVKIRWEGTLAETEIAEQNKIIENMINLEVDGIAVAPLNARGTAKAVANAVDAGIPVVIFDSGIDNEKHVAFIATDNVAGGAIGGKHMVKLLGEGKKRIFVLRYVQGTASSENRAKGFIDTIQAAGYDLVADPFSEDASIAGGKKTATNALEKFVKDNKLEIDGIFACNLYSALGMSAALQDLVKSGIEVKVKFIGFDSSPKLVSELQKGNIVALVAQNPKQMGYDTVQTLVKHLKGEKVEAVVHTQVELITVERLKNEAPIRELVGLKEEKSSN